LYLRSVDVHQLRVRTDEAMFNWLSDNSNDRDGSKKHYLTAIFGLARQQELYMSGVIGKHETYDEKAVKLLSSQRVWHPAALGLEHPGTEVVYVSQMLTTSNGIAPIVDSEA
jgi:hypothetical protein